jgi:long-subunit acyl-CoA synthetase (AMP-forming)/predicted N-acetyltransferase YhbS
MATPPDVDSRNPDPVLAELESTVARTPEELAALVDSALAASADLPAGSPGQEQADVTVLLGLRQHRNVADTLAMADLDRLGELADRWADRLAEAGDDPPTVLRKHGWDVLDLVRRSSLLRRIPENDVAKWSDRILALVERSHFTVGPMFRQRVETYGSKTLFEVPTSTGHRSVSWRQTGLRVEAIGRGLLALGEDGGDPGPVAILSENRLEMALVDLACLAHGIENAMFPANATGEDVGFMLRHCGARTVVVSNEQQLRKVMQHGGSGDAPRRVVILENRPDLPDGVITLAQLVEGGSKTPPERLLERSEAVRIDDRATIMYTSGTTGMPKGIQFSQRNIVFKRFARALALPEIGDRDVFVSYLPLFHTFGRYLEMMGCIFWGATYCFLLNPSPLAMVRAMRQHQPTVLISVPKKWIQLYEAIEQKVDLLRAEEEEILQAVHSVTGGQLRWGLSAAGHLPSEIFRFFQSQGVELMSGFGMTEATGGITMTRPGRYKDDSLGSALPGIELRLAEDGELLIRGPYVMTGYLDPPEGEENIGEDGWLATGDLMVQDRHGNIRLVDRKKEIYKNIKGETIAPQRVENLFRDFESISTVFLVGDHREFNTALIHPNPDCETPAIPSMSSDELQAHIGSLVVSVNKFLSSYERIVDFAIIDRDLDPDRGELTPKGTPRRKVVEQNFGDVIQQMYRRTVLRVGGLEVIFPNWLFQALGVTARDLNVGDDHVTLPPSEQPLTIRKLGDGFAQVGSCRYRFEREPLNLGLLLTSSQLWIGNAELVEFARLDLTEQQRSGRVHRIRWDGYVEPFRPRVGHRESVELAMLRSERDLYDVHLGALMLSAADREAGLAAVRLLESIVSEEEGPLVEPARVALGRAAQSPSIHVRRRAFQVLVLAERDDRFPRTLRRFLEQPDILLDVETRQVLCERNLPDSKLNAILEETRSLAENDAGSRMDHTAASLFRFLSHYGAGHPARYRTIRALLTRGMLFAAREPVRREARLAYHELLDGFRRWLGPNSMIAVDPETSQEYRWDDVVVFDENVETGDRARLLSAIKGTPMLREAVFLFSGGATVRLSDIPPGGVFIRLIGSNHGKTVYRITVQSRFAGSYDVAVNVNQSLRQEHVEQEIYWLILCGEVGERTRLVEDFGGFWAEEDLWTEEFISGETLDHAMRRLSRRKDREERFRQIWPFIAWTAIAAYIDFWKRTAGEWEIADPGISNVIVPTVDYHVGARLVSISARRPHTGLVEMLRWFRERFVLRVEEEYPRLRGVLSWEIVFHAFLEVLGEKDGVEALRAALREKHESDDEEMLAALRAFLVEVEEGGFRPARLYFATERYRRWVGLNVEPTSQARARTLRELYDTYGLRRLVPAYPETRVRFFRETVFENAPEPLAEGLDRIIRQLRRGELVGDDLIDAIADLRARLSLSEDEDYFLARLSFPHLRPEDIAGFVDADLGGLQQSEMVVMLEDREGAAYRVRHALNPREVGRLHRLFIESRLDVRFHQDHQYLVAINDRGQVIGGIFYEIEEGGMAAHLEKIVVAEPYRRRGVAEGLMNEFFNRLSAAGVHTVTTGFFRPEYFYAFGFKIEKRYAGLVKTLDGGEDQEDA